MKRIVLKVGSAVLSENSSLALTRLSDLVEFLSELSEKFEVILVTSGAVAAGYTLVKLDKKDVANKQALAAIGQPLLMSHYEQEFKKYGLNCSQMLLTADDFDSRKRTQHAKNAIEVLLANNVVAIINENDVTATDELVFGDNDQLAAHVAVFFDADLLVILTDIEGYFDKNPRDFKDAKLLKYVNEITDEMLNIELSPNSKFATGGIATKLKAADFILKNNIQMFLSSGFNLSNAKEFLLNNNHISGTLFSAEK